MLCPLGLCLHICTFCFFQFFCLYVGFHLDSRPALWNFCTTLVGLHSSYPAHGGPSCNLCVGAFICAHLAALRLWHLWRLALCLLLWPTGRAGGWCLQDAIFTGWSPWIGSVGGVLHVSPRVPMVAILVHSWLSGVRTGPMHCLCAFFGMRTAWALSQF